MASVLHFSDSEWRALTAPGHAMPEGFAQPVVLPHGAGRLVMESFELAPGICVRIRRGSLDAAIAMRGADGDGTEIAVQLGTGRRIAIGGSVILAEGQPMLSVYSSRGGQCFEITEEPTRDAAFVEFGFAPGAAGRLCPALDAAIGAWQQASRDVGTARLFACPLLPAIAGAARLLAAPSGPASLRPLSARRDAFALLALLSAETAPAAEASERDKVLQAAEILRARLADPPGAALLARLVGLAPNRFAAAFRGEFGLAPGLFVRAERMRRAAARLRGGRVPLARLAWELGYHSTSHFVQAFRAWHGLTPARYARMGGPRGNDIELAATDIGSGCRPPAPPGE